MLDQKLETFLCVCKNMNYTKAAEELGFTQPAVSQHIHYLEDYYSVKLFIYKNRKLYLTEQGKYLKQMLEGIKHDTQRILEEIKHVDSLEVIRIGATMSIGSFYLPEKLSIFMNNHPELNIELTIQDTKILLSMLDCGELDFILCEGYFDKSAYNFALIRKERIIPLCATDYKLPADIKNISDLFHERLLTREPGSGTRAIFENKLYESGFSIDNFPSHCAINQPEVILKMLMEKQGISFLYESVGIRYITNGQLKEINIPDFFMEHEFNAVWKRGGLFESRYLKYIDELTKG